MVENKPQPVGDDAFEEKVTKSQGITVVDFWASWCGPCIHMAPALDALALSNAGKVVVYKVDVDESPKTAQKFDIRSIPTVIFFKDGQPADVSIGAVSESALQGKLDALLEG